MEKSPLRSGEGSPTPSTPSLWEAKRAKPQGEKDILGSLCCVSQQGSGTKAVQKPFVICVMLCVLGYLSIAWLGGGWSRLWSTAPKNLLGQGSCSYGSLPGYWAQKGNSTVGTWTLLDDKCQLQDLVTPLIAESGLRMESSQDVGILILGDSADRNLAFDMCLAAAREVQPFNINVTDGPKTCNRGESWGTYKDVVNCNTCRIPGLRITKESIWGFFEGRTPEDRLGLPLERTQEGLEVFKEEHGRYPDLVVLHSNYWDVAQIVLFREDDGQEHAYGPLMKIWLANAEKVGKFLQAKSAELGFGVAYRTVQYPQMDDCAISGKAKDLQIGERYHVTYLNAAGRELARRFDMYLVDIELMFAKFWVVTDYLSDNHHLNQEANHQVLNIYLNLMRNRAASRQRLAGLGPAAVAAKSRKSLVLDQRTKAPKAEARAKQQKT